MANNNEDNIIISIFPSDLECLAGAQGLGEQRKPMNQRIVWSQWNQEVHWLISFTNQARQNSVGHFGDILPSKSFHYHSTKQTRHNRSKGNKNTMT